MSVDSTHRCFFSNSGYTILISFGCGFERYKIPVQLLSSLHKEKPTNQLGQLDGSVILFVVRRDWI